MRFIYVNALLFYPEWGIFGFIKILMLDFNYLIFVFRESKDMSFSLLH